MSDLVKRLRNPHGHSQIVMRLEAADALAAQAAEVARLKALILNTGNHWLALQHSHPIYWEGAIDAAMEAACKEIARLKALLDEATHTLQLIEQYPVHSPQVLELRRKSRAFLAKLGGDNG